MAVTMMAEMPAWLLEALRGEPRGIAPSLLSSPPGATTPYGQTALDGELAALRNTPAGGRNDQLNRSAFAVSQLAAGGQIEPQEARLALYDAALATGLDSAEIEPTLESGWQAGSLEPRGPKRQAALSACRPSVISARELSEKTFPPLQWILPGLLPEGLAIMAGKPKLGKSFLCLQIAIAVATGEGRQLGVEGIEAGEVLVCALEDSQRRLKERLERFFPFGGVPERLHFSTDWSRLGQGGIERLEDWCDGHPATRLIVLDTWRAIKPQSNGRSSAYDEDATAAAPLLEFAKRHPGVAVLVVHHVRKMDADDIFDMISGTNGLTGIFDTLMVLARHGGGAKLAAQGRDLESYEKALERDRRTGGWTVKGDAELLAKTGERQELLDLLKDASVPLSLSQLAKFSGKGNDTVCHLLRALVKEGLVHQPGHGKYSITQPTQYAQLEEGDY